MPGLRSADRAHGPPEVGRRRLVRGVAYLALQLTVLDPVEALAGELEVVSLHVDRPGPIADDVEAVVYVGDQTVGIGPVCGGLERDIGHALDGHVAGGVGEGATVGAFEAHPGRDRAVELVTHQHSVTDDVPRLRLDAVVVVADRGQAVFDRAVAGHAHDRRAVQIGRAHV